MLGFALKRVLALGPILFGVAVVTFILILLIPGSPVDTLLPPETPPEVRQAYVRALKLDERVDRRFIAWLEHAVRGDFGRSIARDEPARDVMLRALGNTGLLALAAIPIAVVGGIVTGVMVAWWADRFAGKALNTAVVGAASVPQFWLGLILLYVFAVRLQLLPTGGMLPITGESDLATRAKYSFLPAVTVAMLPLAIISRLSRTLFLEIRRQDFVLTLRTRGYSTPRIWRHLLRNASGGVVNIVGLQTGYLVLGTLFAEVVFSWPGIGTAILRAIETRDYPVIQAIVLVTGCIFASITVAIDITMRALDPRTGAH